jgi:NarL family two-component system response regulator YdfI
MIQIAIIAPGMAVRVGLRALLSDDPRVQVIAEAADLRELDPMLVEADVIIWSPAQYFNHDAGLYDLSHIPFGVESALLVISNEPRVVEQLTHLPVRAWGVLDPEATRSELLAGIQAVNEGLVIANPTMLIQALTNRISISDQSSGLIEPLTERETEVLQLLAYGLTNKQIAARLKISAHTVKFHVSSIYTKLGTTNRVEAVNLGLKRGMIVL